MHKDYSVSFFSKLIQASNLVPSGLYHEGIGTTLRVCLLLPWTVAHNLNNFRYAK